MKIICCLLLLLGSIYLVEAFSASGHDAIATSYCFVALACLLMFVLAVDHAVSRLPDAIIRRAMRTPYTHLQGYMERFWFIRIGQRGGGQSGYYPLIGARVHHILRSDDDRHFHDHPWPYLTIILRGGYWEVRPIFTNGQPTGEQREWHGPGRILLRRAGSWYRLELPAGKTAWTLFCTGPKVQPWGFLVGDRKVYWRDYLGVPAGVGVED